MVSCIISFSRLTCGGEGEERQPACIHGLVEHQFARKIAYFDASGLQGLHPAMSAAACFRSSKQQGSS